MTHDELDNGSDGFVGHITWCGCMEVIQAGDWCPACGTMVVAR